MTNEMFTKSINIIAFDTMPPDNDNLIHIKGRNTDSFTLNKEGEIFFNDKLVRVDKELADMISKALGH